MIWGLEYHKIFLKAFYSSKRISMLSYAHIRDDGDVKYLQRHSEKEVKCECNSLQQQN